jgi:hypothetical protein
LRSWSKKLFVRLAISDVYEMEIGKLTRNALHLASYAHNDEADGGVGGGSSGAVPTERSNVLAGTRDV